MFFGISGHIHPERLGDVSRTVTGAVVNDVNIGRQNTRLRMLFNRLTDAHGLVFRRKQHAKFVHSWPFTTNSRESKETE